MANTTSGTYTFDKTFAIDDTIAEAYERISTRSSVSHLLPLSYVNAPVTTKKSQLVKSAYMPVSQ